MATAVADSQPSQEEPGGAPNKGTPTTNTDNKPTAEPNAPTPVAATTSPNKDTLSTQPTPTTTTTTTTTTTNNSTPAAVPKESGGGVSGSGSGSVGEKEKGVEKTPSAAPVVKATVKVEGGASAVSGVGATGGNKTDTEPAKDKPTATVTATPTTTTTTTTTTPTTTTTKTKTNNTAAVKAVATPVKSEKEASGATDTDTVMTEASESANGGTADGADGEATTPSKDKENTSLTCDESPVADVVETRERKNSESPLSMSPAVYHKPLHGMAERVDTSKASVVHSPPPTATAGTAATPTAATNNGKSGGGNVSETDRMMAGQDPVLEAGASDLLMSLLVAASNLEKADKPQKKGGNSRKRKRGSASRDRRGNAKKSKGNDVLEMREQFLTKGTAAVGDSSELRNVAADCEELVKSCNATFDRLEALEKAFTDTNITTNGWGGEACELVKELKRRSRTAANSITNAYNKLYKEDGVLLKHETKLVDVATRVQNSRQS